MSGLLFTNEPALSRQEFLTALELMDHRGSEATGRYSSAGSAQLGHHRLATFDQDPLSVQPYSSSDGRYQLIYDGEIYNYRELADRHRINVRTSGDTEVLVELYAKLGEGMLTELNGSFALVILDLFDGDLFAARDRLGIKPLYHRAGASTHTFSSEVAPILELFPGHGIDNFGLRQYRKLRTFFNGRTLYEGISLLPAGCYFKDGRVHRYWSLPQGAQEPPVDEELRDLLESSVRYRNTENAKVGSYLSGGLDSTIIAGLAAPEHTWTIGTDNVNEFKWAAMGAEPLDNTHHQILTTPEEFLATAEAMILKRREPLAVPNEVMLYLMSKAATEYNTVLLSGEGADELFFGYDRIFGWAAEQGEPFDIRGFDRLYSYGSHRDDEVLEEALAPFLTHDSTLGVVAEFFQVAHIHGLLRRLDYSTALCGIEARAPFLDHRLIERMAGVAYDYRTVGGVSKAPLRRVFSDLVPQAIIDRPKVGFPVDLAAAFQGFGRAGASGMEKWLAFNLEVLGIDG